MVPRRLPSWLLQNVHLFKSQQFDFLIAGRHHYHHWLSVKAFLGLSESGSFGTRAQLDTSQPGVPEAL